MALYQDGILISGANTLPKMTLADYKAMPADQRPTYWERLDADYDDVLAPKTDIATVESGTTASRAYSVGELVYVSGTLYRVKTDIASGATFTVGTNIEVTNVSNQIKNALEWKYLGQTTGNAEISIPDNATEVIGASGSGAVLSQFYFATVQDTLKYVRNGYYISANNNSAFIFEWDASTRKAKLYSLISNGTDKTSEATTKWYTR